MSEPPISRGKATGIGFTAVLMWSLLAILTIGSAPVPPLQLNAMCFGIGGIIGLIWTAQGVGLGVLRDVSWKVYAFGTVGLFGYHFLYFTAFRIGPNAATGLIAYLWPLLIVLFSGLLPGERLTFWSVLGALVALGGVGILVLGGGGGQSDLRYDALVLAFGCALTWSGYSVLSRRLQKVPTETVTVFCLATAALSVIAHLLLEQTIWPRGATGWLSVALLGIGPVGIAFFAWDVGMKRGNVQLLGVASYAAPLLSTLVLVAAGNTRPSFAMLFAAVMIGGGAMMAALATKAPVKE
jgi:drug/metabolite transporter (DMT)-like permease